MPWAIAFILIAVGIVATANKMRLVCLLGALVLVIDALPQLAGQGSLATAAQSVAVVCVILAVLVTGVMLAERFFAPALPARRAAARAKARELRVSEVKRRRLSGLLRREHRRLETVNEMHRYFELATRNSQITVFYQNADLRYEWIVNPRSALTPSHAIGRTDDVLPEAIRPMVIGHKRRALTTSSTQTFEIEVPGEEERSWFRIDVVPISHNGDEPVGLVCTAIDITRSKRLDMMRTDLSRRLAETLQRFNLALRSERITVFSQDLSLRYTWANSDETQVGSIIGRTDEEILSPQDLDPIVSLKRGVIETKRPASAEIGIGEGVERRWYDLHVEPNLKPDGSVSGITCASIDITHRRRNEEQMRLVMRELTHRTKNLLTVVIAIARQTSNQATTVEAFVPALIARLRALSAAQDLIVADDWAGVNIGDLIRVLVGQFVPPMSDRVTIDGPRLILSPEASQNLGLAIHELAANAMQYGAFANGTGTLAVSWELEGEDEGGRLSLTWVEEGGPAVVEPTTRGFGMTVIERNLSRALGAKVDLSFEASGLTARMTLPLQSVVPIPSPDRIALAQAS
ncbi:PAS domain-containing protein [Acuticoccus sp. 2012]|uniref:histidine kinase n=2 Tax=Acuticoccus mangrovi TaxID=2796142 RepID=A0A934ILI8_9HYPH|nr:PAS domain-containing protein [Acuticoccus mangrovi]